MSETHFLIVRRYLSAAQVRRVDQIVKDEGGTAFVYTGRQRGQEIYGWCVGPNDGPPFDRDLRGRVLQALRRENLAWLFGEAS